MQHENFYNCFAVNTSTFYQLPTETPHSVKNNSSFITRTYGTPEAKNGRTTKRITRALILSLVEIQSHQIFDPFFSSRISKTPIEEVICQQSCLKPTTKRFTLLLLSEPLPVLSRYSVLFLLIFLVDQVDVLLQEKLLLLLLQSPPRFRRVH